MTTPLSVLDLHGNHLIVPEGQDIVVSLQLQWLPVLIGGVESHDVFTRAPPLPGAPDHQGVIEVVVAGYLDGLGLWGRYGEEVCVCACVCECV